MELEGLVAGCSQKSRVPSQIALCYTHVESYTNSQNAPLVKGTSSVFFGTGSERQALFARILALLASVTLKILVTCPEVDSYTAGPDYHFKIHLRYVILQLYLNLGRPVQHLALLLRKMC